MNLTPAQHELLLRQMDGRVSATEAQEAVELLRASPAARALLREIAEQAVMVAEIEQTAQDRQEAAGGRVAAAPGRARNRIIPVDSFSRRTVLAAAALLALLGAVVVQFMPTKPAATLRVAKVTGSGQFFGSSGKVQHSLSPGTLLGLGDTLGTRSCDAWTELELAGGSTLTIAGNTTLRILEDEPARRRFGLLYGNLWVDPGQRDSEPSIEVQTPTATVKANGAQFDLQTSATATLLRVNQGAARFVQLLDGTAWDVPEGHQIVASLSKPGAAAVIPQPKPIDFWNCELARIPDVKLGRWLPSGGGGLMRLGAQPLLWPVPEREPVLLHAVALSASSSSERPVLLRSDSRFRFYGRTERAQFVRFGFSTQRMRGVFAGKFETDVAPEALGPAGEPWTVELPLVRFRPLHPQFQSTPDGLELTDVYALTVRVDAGLEIHRIDLIPAGLAAAR